MELVKDNKQDSAAPIIQKYRDKKNTVKAFVVTPSWNVRNFGHLCFWADFYFLIHIVIKPVF